ncbi:MAG: amidohydrolase [Lachnospiraceae bacterium]|nr:amidohydrolase [Lachnospiraceae bacterium]
MWNTCKTIQSELVAMRRDLHRIPEFGGDLPKTKAYVIEKLEEMGIPYKENPTDSGLVAIINEGVSGKTLAFRADMDALKIQEENDLEFKSEHEGLMHACGHDAHMAMLLGAAKVLNENKEKIPGTVKLIFQTDEENSRGAERSIAAGCLDGVDAIFGTHIGTLRGKEIPAGTVISHPGSCMASFDKFVLKVKGYGCHGSTPEKGIDPINIAAHIVVNLQAVIAREISAVKPAVLTIGHIEAGDTYNIIPSEVLIEGTTRAFEEEVRQLMAKRIGEIAEATAKTFGGEVEYEMIWGAPPVINNAAMAALAAECAREVVGEENVIDHVDAPITVGEDFSCYANLVPAAFLFLSSSNPKKNTDAPHHNCKFDVDEDVLWIGPAVFVKIAEKFFNI